MPLTSNQIAPFGNLLSIVTCAVTIRNRQSSYKAKGSLLHIISLHFNYIATLIMVGRRRTIGSETCRKRCVKISSQHPLPLRGIRLLSTPLTPLKCDEIRPIVGYAGGWQGLFRVATAGSRGFRSRPGANATKSARL